ncbi:MAG: putative acylglycerol lipase [Ilumatobacteraceae bacterium]|nr:putative acylglycerol lipase [Ilumatobacteraceae bacterium]
MTDTLIPGADAWSHTGTNGHGALVLHGFTGNPGSMRGVAEAFAAAGYNVELPRLPGHGTTVEDMLTTGWADWSAAADESYAGLAARSDAVVVIGLSMGGSLTLWLAGHHPEIAGIVCINPATQPQAPEVVDMINGMIAEGTTVMPGIGSDIADPDAHESAYEGTPLPCLLDFVESGLRPLETTYESLRMPMLLLNSPQDHVVEPAQAEFLATHYGGPLERITLERSFHVATQDFDKELIFSSSVEFADRVINS